MARQNAERPIDDHNRSVYESPEIVAEFARLRGLFPCEQYLFAKYVVSGDAALDLGVGAGRTIPFLSARANPYVGIDYSLPMIESCLEEHHGVDIRLMDASDLSAFASGSFGAAVFSYNGIDYLHPLQKRELCLTEIRRVLRPGGVFLFSSHNARAIARPRPPSTGGLRGWAKANAIQALSTTRLLARALPSRSLWAGSGYVRDTATDNVNFATTARRTAADLADLGFEVIEVVSSGYPNSFRHWMDPWLYYACRSGAR